MKNPLEELDHIITRNTLGAGEPGKDSSDLGKLALITKKLLTDLGADKAPAAPAPAPPAS